MRTLISFPFLHGPLYPILWCHSYMAHLELMIHVTSPHLNRWDDRSKCMACQKSRASGSLVFRWKGEGAQGAQGWLYQGRGRARARTPTGPGHSGARRLTFAAPLPPPHHPPLPGPETLSATPATMGRA